MSDYDLTRLFTNLKCALHEIPGASTKYHSKSKQNSQIFLKMIYLPKILKTKKFWNWIRIWKLISSLRIWANPMSWIEKSDAHSTAQLTFWNHEKYREKIHLPNLQGHRKLAYHHQSWSLSSPTRQFVELAANLHLKTSQKVRPIQLCTHTTACISN